MSRWRIRALTATAGAVLSLSVAASGAAAQGEPVGTPGTPSCHGERISAGNQKVEDIPELGLTDFRLTPEGRTELLNAFGVDGRTDWTVQDFQARVRAACATP